MTREMDVSITQAASMVLQSGLHPEKLEGDYLVPYAGCHRDVPIFVHGTWAVVVCNECGGQGIFHDITKLLGRPHVKKVEKENQEKGD